MGGMQMAASPWSLEALGGAFVMWSVMMMAMMLPSLIVPMRAVQSANRSALAGGRRSTPAALFAVGVMNLAWVVTLAAVVLIEKLGIGGPWPARIAGAGLILWGLARL